MARASEASSFLQETPVAKPLGEAHVPGGYREVGAVGADAIAVTATAVDVELGVDAGLAKSGEERRELLRHAVVVGARQECGRRRLLRPGEVGAVEPARVDRREEIRARRLALDRVGGVGLAGI